MLDRVSPFPSRCVFRAPRSPSSLQITSWWTPTAPAPVPARAYDPTDPKQNPLNPQGLKPCCACPETKSKRDDCFLAHDGEEAGEKCRELVQRHIACMRGLGFNL
ncbi:cytochrome C oxidase copper chaperone-domain-containing protein [Amylostereum chailletii]|nr:cytochrome C oxidase copper chaperone-domain-containing protein [Amylostereum chailletii]